MGERRPEAVDKAIARLQGAAAAEKIEYGRLSENEVALRADGVSSLVTFEPGAHAFRREGLGGLRRRSTGAGDRFPGAGRFPLSDSDSGVGFGMTRSTILAGRGLELSTALVREAATGKWEPQPTNRVGFLVYDELVLHGWHQRCSRQTLALIACVALVLIVVIAVLAVALLV
ncbi:MULTISPECIES: hypothetical protein [Gordonia]|uniref:hypothetical protein n=1 Tax=Gordonia TaxID=2053 RepID=UPI0007EACB61|nr:hypothetical protein [Gordonia sp. 852002-50395_SCH5434458]OBC08488.1 hypothetical protein A5785_05900 [Gordonia sp. 852002-50395_SCH5434458]